jgi:redox-sensing transcriptional repressor
LRRRKTQFAGIFTAGAPRECSAAQAGSEIIFNYSEALLDVPSDVNVHTSNQAVALLYALYFHLT